MPNDVNPHLIFNKETTFGTYLTTGQVAMPLTNAQFTVGQQNEDVRAFGSGRALARNENTVLKPGFAFETNVWQEYMGRFLRGAILTPTTTTPAGGTLARLHGFRPVDTALFSMCMELQHTAGFAEFERGCVIDTLDFAFDEEGLATCSISGLALDYCYTGANFISGVTTPSITASPPYFATTIRPFVVHQAIVKLGGTVSYNATNGRFEVSGGTQYSVMKTLNFSLSNSLEHVMTKHGYKIPYTIHAGARSVTFGGDISQLTIDTTHLAAYIDGTTQVVEVLVTGEIIEGAIPYQFGFVIPKCKITTGDMMQETGAIDEPVQSIEGIALENADGCDFTAHVQDKQTAY